MDRSGVLRVQRGNPSPPDSTLLRILNDGDYAGVPVQLRRWNKETIDGKLVINRGLVNRRESEITLWNQPA